MNDHIAVKIPGETAYRWYDLREMRKAPPADALPPGVGTVMGIKFHATNKFIEREDGELAQIYEIDATPGSLVHQDQLRAARDEFKIRWEDYRLEHTVKFPGRTIAGEPLAWRFFLIGKGLKP